MDWRAMSRSRSRLSMDWRPASRSRSRPPESAITFDQHGMYNHAHEGRFVFPTTQDHIKSPDDMVYNKHSPIKTPMSTSSSIPIPGTGSSMHYGGRRSPSYNPLQHHRLELASVYEDQSENANSLHENADSQYLHSTQNYNQALSSLSSPVFAPSSLPSVGLHGLTRIPSAPHGLEPAVEERSFPRHVRKTSFDHTVSKDGIMAGLTGRHQVNGKPLPPENSIGTKRRAETPHHESMLRADPSNVGGTSSRREPDRHETSGLPFPSTAFNFSFPSYDNLFTLPPTDLSSNNGDFSNGNEGRYNQYHHSSGRSPTSNRAYQQATGSSQNTNEGLSAAAAAASAVMAEGYAQLNAANLAGVDDPLLDYNQLLGLMYPGLDGSSSLSTQSLFTHVDPTQILSVGQGENNTSGTTSSVGGNAGVSGGPGGYSNFASPSSDGWGNGVGSSSAASPEPHNTSNASTPPSTEGPLNNAQGSRQATGGRKYIPLKAGAQEALIKKKSLSTTVPNAPAELRSSASTPDLAGMAEKGGGDDGETPTLCTNCKTTNTPLWRRDPEGQPLCT